VNSAYADYLKTIGDKFTALIGEIKTDYNFDFGDEFEIAVCKALRGILPTRYGVCRGTIFTIDNRSAGDDIIIFDQWRFPVLRLLDDNNYAQKQRIPIEAVMAYIEAKNTIVIEDGHGNSLSKSVRQATAIKKLGRKEERHKPNVAMGSEGMLFQKKADFHPEINNPFYACIFARGVKPKPNTALLESSDVHKYLLAVSLASDDEYIDLAVLNNDIFIFPLINKIFYSPFWIKGKSNHHLYNHVDLAWGIGISMLFLAFESIELGSMDWQGIIGNALGMKEIQ